MPTTTIHPTLPIGTVVTYHGSIELEHGFPYIITGTEHKAGKVAYHLRCRDYGTTVMHGTRRSSITPTGETITRCPWCRRDWEDCDCSQPRRLS